MEVYIVVAVFITYVIYKEIVSIKHSKNSSVLSEQIVLLTNELNSLKQASSNSVSKEFMLNELRENKTELSNFISELGRVRDEVLETKLKSIDKEMQKVNETSSELKNTTNDVLGAKFISLEKRLNTITENIASLKHLDNIVPTIDNLNKTLSSTKLRGQFGERQLEQVLSSIYGDNSPLYELQYSIKSGSGTLIADSVLKSYAKEQVLCIDSKFPLENYANMCQTNNQIEKDKYAKLFKADVKKHIDAVNKYVLPPQTLEYAVMFVPAEAVFLAICEDHELLEYAYKKSVFIASHNTLFALLYTFKLLSDDAKRSEDLTAIREELRLLSKEFELFIRSRNDVEKYLLKASEEFATYAKRGDRLANRFKNVENSSITS